MKLKKILYYLIHDRTAFAIAILQRMAILIPDRLYIRLLFRLKMGYPLDLKNPQTFNEKLQWMKLYDRKPEYTKLVDKYQVKQYVAAAIGKQYIIPTLGVWDRFEDIDFSSLPEQFVLKTTHGGGGGGVVVCRNKSTFDIDNARDKIVSSLKNDIYRSLREWPYKDVPKRIIAEKYIHDGNDELRDYKFFCFNGHVKCFKIDFNRFIDHHANYYNPDGNLLPFGEECYLPDYSKTLEIPDNLHDMIELAESLSKGHPFLRVDLYNTKGKIYFGELTFFPASGLGKFTSPEWDSQLGEYINLRQYDSENI